MDRMEKLGELADAIMKALARHGAIAEARSAALLADPRFILSPAYDALTGLRNAAWDEYEAASAARIAFMREGQAERRAQA